MINVAGSPKELIASVSISANGDTFSNTFQADELLDAAYISLDVSSRTDGTYTLTLQHSWDDTNWYDLQSTSGLVADGQGIAKITETSILGKLRLKLTAASVTTGATIKGTLIK